jgi:hypothetical protein
LPFWSFTIALAWAVPLTEMLGGEVDTVSDVATRGAVPSELEHAAAIRRRAQRKREFRIRDYSGFEDGSSPSKIHI